MDSIAKGMNDVFSLMPWMLGSGLYMMSFAFYYAYRKKRIDVVDAFWGMTILTVVAVASMILRPLPMYSWIVVALVAIWGIRLSYHIGRRFERSKQVDERYIELTKPWPKKAYWMNAYVRVYIVQAVLAVLIAIAPVIAASKSSLSLFFWAGTTIWLIGFVIEVVADRQLASFLRANKNGVMTKGLWRYSRHPNYFGELMMWWGIWVMTLGTTYWHIALVSPVVITVLIIFVSGIPPAERRGKLRKGWTQYKKQTSVLLPLPPAKQ